jgi:hypothetical protein
MFANVFKPAELTEVGVDILYTPFLEEEFCDYIVAACIGVGTWAPNKADRRYATDDIHFNTELLDLYDMLNSHLKTTIWPLVAKHWMLDTIELSDLFAIKYDLKGKTSLGLHHDNSFITGSVKLNNYYKGAELVLPRQNFSNKEIPVGGLLIFPSKITHPHACSTLTEGRKYSLTIWTRE